MKTFINFSSFAPDNVSGMDRKRTGNGSALPRHLFTLLFALFICAGQIWGNETFTAGTDKSDDTSIEKGCVTISFTDGTFSRDDNYRCYANKSMTIESAHSITKIEITCTGSGTSSNGPGKFSLKSGVSGSYSYSGKVGTWSYASGATSITLNASAQVRMTEIVVTYAATAPTSVTKGTITTSSAGLTITDSKNTGSYEIYYSTNSGAPNANTTATTTVTTKTPTLTSLSDGTTYYVWVRSKCSDDSKSSWTALTGGSFSTPSAGPACTDPDGPGKGSINGTSATLTFSESGNYEIYCSTSNTTPTGSTSASGSVSGGTSVTVSNLAYGTTYYYWGRKVCDENSKSNWVAGSATTFTTTIPAPTGLSAGSISKNGATFTITDANSVNNYEIYYSTTNSAPGASPSGTATTTSKTKEVTGLTVGATYYCWVRAKGPNANSSWFSGGSFATLHEYTLSYKETDETANGSGTVVENATSFTNSTAPSKTGYNLEGFYAESSLTTKVANASRQFVENVTNWTGASGAYTKGANANLYLNWTAKTTTVSFDIEGGSGTITNVTATYGQAMPSKESNLPTKEGYNFGGFWDGDDGTGTQYYDADGKSARTWNKEDATFTLHALWTIKNYTVTWKVNGEPWSDKGGTANVNHNTAWSSLTLPTAPDPDNDGCGQKFVGWTTEENYSNATTAPTDLLNADNKSSKTAVLITDNVVFHAVFADYDEE